MTDKVKKIREEVVGILNSINLFTPDEDGKNSSYEAGRLDVASKILQVIDSMQEDTSKVSSKVSEDLDIAIGEYCSNPDNFITYIDGWPKAQNADDIPLIEKAIRFGAAWQKQQMMKNAVSGHIGETVNGILRALSDEVDEDLDITAGDKVKLIIIKGE